MSWPAELDVGNRRNARFSTGPKSAAGKRRSRRNALRHGLAAETVVEACEDPKHYKKFQAAIVADYAPESTVAHELVLRIASLLWRLRRATFIETGLLEMQAKRPLQLIEHARSIGHTSPSKNASPPNFCTDIVNTAGEVAESYLNLDKLHNAAFDRLGRYEARLWRELAQTLVIVDLMKRLLPLARAQFAKRRGRIRPSFETMHMPRHG